MYTVQQHESILYTTPFDCLKISKVLSDFNPSVTQRTPPFEDYQYLKDTKLYRLWKLL